MPGTTLHLERKDDVHILRLQSDDGTNRLTKAAVLATSDTVRGLSRSAQALIIIGNDRFFSAGADLVEIAALSGSEAYEFSRIGRELMGLIEDFPAPVYAAISGYCMGGGLDLALACRYRIASRHAIFGHRGAALGLITGWGGTRRLPRLIGKAYAVEMFITAEKIAASRALEIGLVDAIADDPIAEAVHRIVGQRGK